MKRGRAACTSAIAVTMLMVSPHAQSGAQQPPGYSSVTTAVLVDVVVRDRDGRPVTDLTAEDFEIREDAVVQQIGSFTRVSRGAGIGITVGVKDPSAPTLVTPPASAGDEPDAPEPDPGPSTTALVFDALSPEAVAMCQRAALDYIPMSGLTHTRVGVFTTEPSLRAVQSYTDDPARVRQAVLRVSSTGTSVKDAKGERMASLRERRDALDRAQQVTMATVSGGGPVAADTAGSIGQVEIERRLVQGQMRMLEAFDSLDRDQRGFGTTSALFGVLQTLVEMPGRKTLVFFSEGMPASPALQAHLQSVVDVANRANVTVYAIDASGLRAVSGTTETRSEVEEAGKERLRQLQTPGDYTDQPLTRMVERTEDLLRLDSQGGLAKLAEETGGFLVRDTNDLRGAFRRIDEDMRFHYLLTYEPSNQTLDGRYRRIEVKVNRPGVQVFARKGYRALRFAPTVPVLDYEAPAVAALDASRLVNGFPFETAVFNFPEPFRPGLSPVVVRLRTGVLTYEQDPAKDTYDADATIVVRFRDQAGNVVQKVSQQYHLTGRTHELEAAKRGEILFYRDPELAPGLYTVEAAVFDAVGTRASTRVSTLEVPKPSDRAIRMSSIVFVNRVEKVGTGERQPNHPLYVGDLLLYPSGGEPFTRDGDKELTFFYTLYGVKGTSLPPATIELRRNGRVLASLQTPLDPPDGDGRIQQVSRLPLAPLTPGTYELRVVILADGESLERSGFFQIAR